MASSSVQAVLAPGQVIGFFLSGTQERFAGGIIFSGQGLPFIQALSADLAGMVYAHEAGGMLPFAVVHHRVVDRIARARPFGDGFGGHRAQGAVETDHDVVYECHICLCYPRWVS